MKIVLRTLCLAMALILALTAPASAFWFFGEPEKTPEAVPVIAQAAEPSPAPSPEATPLPAPEKRETEESGMLRVYLKSLADHQALGITLSGVYSVERDPGFRFEAEADVSVSAESGTLYLKSGGLIINMGQSFTLTRHADDRSNGLSIHETGRETLYLGDLALTAEGNTVRAVLTTDVEDYLCGVVPYEMSDSFPIEALKAQAVAARTYAMNRKSSAGGKAYDVVDTTDDQVFRGFDPDTENAAAAIEATRGVTGFYKDRYAACFFTASNGGQIALPGQIWGGDGDYGYIESKDDPYDTENAASVVKTYELPADPEKLEGFLKSALISGLTEQMAALGYSDEAADVKILKIVSAQPSDPKFGEGNRMFRQLLVGMTVEGKRVYTGGPSVTPDAATTPANLTETVPETLYVALDFYGMLKAKCGLGINKSDWEVLSVVPKESGFTLESRRFGHGVGMSQRGAQQMARAHGMNWQEILAFYYPGMTLYEMAYRKETPAPLSAIPASLGYARPRPTPKPTPAPLPALAPGETYARVTLGSKASSLNVRSAPGPEGGIVGTLDHGQRVIVTRTYENGWARIRTAELSGYASAEYLTAEP